MLRARATELGWDPDKRRTDGPPACPAAEGAKKTLRRQGTAYQKKRRILNIPYGFEPSTLGFGDPCFITN